MSREENRSAWEKLAREKDFWGFVEHLSDSTLWNYYRTPIAEIWRQKYVYPLEREARSNAERLNWTTNDLFSSDVFELERKLEHFMDCRMPEVARKEMSVAQMCELVHGKEWTDKYREMSRNNCLAFTRKVYEELREGIHDG